MREPGQTAPTILYVDDTEAQRYAVSRVLRRAGFQVLEAVSGRQALEMSAQGPDIIVLDVNLPDINGLEVCQRIKANESTSNIPVLQVSATLVDTKHRVAGLEGGADAYLVQPMDPDELVATIRSLLRIRNAEAAAFRRAQEIEAIYSSAPVGLALLDKDLRYLKINHTLAELNGLPPEKHVGRTMRELFPQLEAQVGNLYQRVLSTGESLVNAEVKAHAPLQPEILRDWLVNLHPLKDDNGDILAVNAVVQDITEHKRAEELAMQQETQKHLLEHEILARESERERLARELHDESGQMLTSLLAGLRLIEESRTIADAKKQARTLRELTSRAIGEVGRLSRDLHPIVLDDLGFSVALRNYVSEYSTLHGLKAEIEIIGLDARRLPRAVERGLYRIAQEALTNIARHARASQVAILVELRDHNLTMTIRDNGCGFATRQSQNGSRKHLGLQSMRERASILGGQFKAESIVGKGTSITVTLTIPADDKSSAPEAGPLDSSGNSQH
ncbi:MAG TPA: response regulator [Candidatus Sulfotelmatobacter sp.]|nr:response regulator [Candidatus Sulfotelmatobacter sp.]